MNKGKYKILKNTITACDYTYVLQIIKQTIKSRNRLLVSPIASQTLVRAYYDQKIFNALESIDLLLPDSQWVKWSIWFLYGVRLKKRVYGPELMKKICELSEKETYPIYLYGSTNQVLLKLKERLLQLCPMIQIVGSKESKFRDLNSKEISELISQIYNSKAKILFIGLGSPLQELFSAEIAKKNIQTNTPIAIISIGAAFDFIAGTKKQAPRWVGDCGFEWLYRLLHEPKRLWRRYFSCGLLYLWLVVLQKIDKKNEK